MSVWLSVDRPVRVIVSFSLLLLRKLLLLRFWFSHPDSRKSHYHLVSVIMVCVVAVPCVAVGFSGCAVHT